MREEEEEMISFRPLNIPTRRAPPGGIQGGGTFAQSPFSPLRPTAPIRSSLPGDHAAKKGR